MKNESKRCIHNLQFLAYWYVKFAQCTIQSELDSYLYTSTLLPKPVNYMDIIHMPTNQPHKSKNAGIKILFLALTYTALPLAFISRLYSRFTVPTVYVFLSLQHLY